VWLLVFGVASGQQTPPPSVPKIAWVHGPITAKLGNVAEIKVPAGYEFADGAGARQLMELNGNPTNGSELGVVVPASNDKEDNWVILFEFDETGYVKDDEKDKIDAPALLESMKKGTEQENVERKKRGWEPFHLTGWQTQPFYEETTHNLTWGTTGETDDPKQGVTINYTTRLLGRRGVMRTDLITSADTIDAVLPRFRSVMGGFAFTSGSRYADFVKGDKVAEYGLTALIAGGATAVALKTGLFAKLLGMLAALWKVIAVAFAALISRIKNIMAAIRKRLSGKKSEGPGDDLAPR
jgi:uncharacterized membrane-anchored protein